MESLIKNARDLLKKLQPIKQAIYTAGQNLSAWGQVATQPTLRTTYNQNVIQPKVQQVSNYVKPILQQQYSLQTQLNRIGSFGLLPSTPQYGEAPFTPLREFLKPKSYLGGPAGKSIAATIEGALPALIPTMGGGGGKLALNIPQMLKSGAGMAGFTAAMNALQGKKQNVGELGTSFAMGVPFGMVGGLENIGGKRIKVYRTAEVLEPNTQVFRSKAMAERFATPENPVRSFSIPESLLKPSVLANKAKVGIMDFIGTRVVPSQESGAINLGAKIGKVSKISKQEAKLLPQKLGGQLGKLQKPLLNQEIAPKVSNVGNEVYAPARPLKTPVGIQGGEVSSAKIIPQTGKYAENINLNKLNLTPKQKQVLVKNIDSIKPLLEKIKGKTLSNREVIQAAKKSDILTKITTRDETLAAEASILKARQKLVSLNAEVTQLAKAGKTPQLKAKMTDLIESLRVVSSTAADTGRKLKSFDIQAGDEGLRATLIKEISKTEKDTSKILDEALKVDWNNANSITSFYRKFIKPSTMEILDEYRYNNMLSNPRTHIRNAFSNLIQTFVTRPATIAFQGDIKGTGQYYQGALSSFPKAVDSFLKAFKGEAPIMKPDIAFIGTGKLPRPFTVMTRAMEAGDKFFSALIKGGEMARGVSEKEAAKTAEYSLFRQGLFQKGQGHLLNAIDSVTAWTYKAPKLIRWFVPFIRTPMNFAKQWIEYSPAGLATLPGSTAKKEQLAKFFIGSVVTAIGAKFALDGNTTWDVPTDPTQKELFYASGKKPFSVKVGNNWVPMMYAGSLAMAFALPAATKFYQDESRTTLTDSQLAKLGKITMSMARFLSGQTFLGGLNNFVRFASGDVDYSLPSSLAFTAGQVIPWEGLVSYINTIIDPVYRKGKTFTGALKKNIPILSKTLEPYTEPSGELSTRKPINYITPYDITPQNQQYEGIYQLRTKLLQFNNINKKAKDLFDAGQMEQASALIKANKDIFQQGMLLQDFNKKMNSLYNFRDKLMGETRLSKEQKAKYLKTIQEQIKQMSDQANKLNQYLEGGQ